MKLVRTFHPIGQGAFYTERIIESTNKGDKNLFSVVYDCGTLTSTCDLNAIIDDEFDQDDVIDALFISHFHIDHISGIDHMLKRCDVRRIYVPVMTPDMIIEAFLYCAVTKYSIIDLLSKIISKIYSDDRTVHIIDSTQDNTNISTHIFHSGVNIGLWKKWHYIPFHQSQNLLSHLLNQEPLLGASINGQRVDIQKLTQIIKSKNRKFWQKVYKQAISGNQHNYVLTLYSGDEGDINEVFIQRSKEIYYQDKELRNCLYTGDFAAKNQKNFANLKKCYNSYWNSIGLLQVPHHGSKNNYTDSLYDKVRCCVISAGTINKYNHPNYETLIGILKNNCFPMLVTEKQSALKFIYQL